MDDSTNNRIIKSFKYLSEIMFIGIIFLIAIEGFSYLVIEIYNGMNPVSQSYPGSPDWLEQYYKEQREAYKFEYAPYVEFIRKPNYHGKYVNINGDSLRSTWNVPLSNENESKPIRIFCLGGSTMWGEGSRDNYTIPSYLSKYLYQKGYPVNVINLGEDSLTNTQELIKLQLELRKGNIPDIVIFYDGTNDVYSAYHNKVAGYPISWEIHKGLLFNPVKHFILYYLAYGKTPILMRGAYREVYNFLPRDSDPNIKDYDQSINENLDSLIIDTAEIYLNNIKIVQALGNEYGFKTYFFWQPMLFTKRNLSSAEKHHLNELWGWHSPNSGIREFFNRTYSFIYSRHASSDIMDFYYLGDSFDKINETIYLDTSHISEDGNRIIAEKIGDCLIPVLDCANCTQDLV